MNTEKVCRIELSREKWAIVHGALMDAYYQCRIDEQRCSVCREWKEVAVMIERKLPKSMIPSPSTFWKKGEDLDA